MNFRVTLQGGLHVLMTCQWLMTQWLKEDNEVMSIQNEIYFICLKYI